MKATGRNDGLLQDYNRKLHMWFASRIDARYVLRKNLEGIKMKYRIDVEFTGYETLNIEADSLKEAEEKAAGHFDEVYMKLSLETLRCKSFKCNNLAEGWDD